jgi:hypothetical protein
MENTIRTFRLNEFRTRTFRSSEALKISSPEQAIDFVNERGFIFFWPVKGIIFPSLWSAVAGDRPVADNHEDPGHISWEWKDSLLDKKVWYYARILRGKNTIVSMDTIPFFYALSPNYGDPEADLEEQYFQGHLPMEAKQIFETLLRKGPLDTISLRKEAHLTGEHSNSPFARALDLLQRQLVVLPVKVVEAGAWNYAFVYDLTHRYLPDLPEKARFITENHAMEQLLIMFFSSLGAASSKQINSLFRWDPNLLQPMLDRMVKSGILRDNIHLEDSAESFYCLTAHLDSLL